MTTATKQREPLTALHRVTYDRHLSTPWWEHYPAKSDSRPGLILSVWHNVEAGTWTCDELQCPGYKHHRTCHHIGRAKRLRAVRIWMARYLGWPRAELAAERGRLAARADAGPLWVDDLDALDALNWILGEREKEAARCTRRTPPPR
jgi:hypothetical protein